MSDEQSILIAVDPPSSLPDLAPVLALALGTGWKIHLVNAVAVGVEADGPAAENEIEEAQTALTAQATTLAASAPVDVDARVMAGPPVDVVLTMSNTLDSALIVVVGRKRDIGGRPALGSFTSALLKVADRPVLVLPAGSAGNQLGFVAAVDRLIELIDREQASEPRSELGDLREAATAQLQQPDSEQRSRHLGQRLVDTLHRLETSHPHLTRAINDVSYHLSGMGI